MKAFIGLVALVASTLAFGQSSEWKLTEVKGKDTTPAGYIYHNYSVGTQRTDTVEKVVSGLRIICSTTKGTYPIVALYWNGRLSGDPLYSPVWTIDGKAIPTGIWTRFPEGKIISRPVSETTELMLALKNGHLATVAWTGSDAVRYSTAFDLTNYQSHLAEFEAACK